MWLIISSAWNSRTWRSCSASEVMVHDPKNLQVRWTKPMRKWSKGNTRTQEWQDLSALKAETLRLMNSIMWVLCSPHGREEGVDEMDPCWLYRVGSSDGAQPMEKAWRCLLYSLIKRTVKWPLPIGRRNSDWYALVKRLVTAKVDLSLYINHSLEKASVNSMSCYTNSRMKRNFLLQRSQSQCTSSDPPASQMSSVGAVAFPASVELTFSPLLPVDSVGNSGGSRNISIKGKKF